VASLSASASMNGVLRPLLRRGETGRCGREDLLGGRIRVVARRLGFTREGQLECREISGQNSRKHVETHVLKDAVGHLLRCGREPRSLSGRYVLASTTALVVPSHRNN